MIDLSILYRYNYVKHLLYWDSEVVMKEYTACFTGHRQIPFGQTILIKRRLDKVIADLVQQGIIYYGAGGALGFDTMAAQAVLRARRNYPQIKLILVLPCPTQADRWAARDKEIYEEIKRQADKIVYVSEHYTKSCMFQRNRHLVDYSGICIAYLTEDNGGTAYTVNYAQSKGLQIINLAER